MIAVGAWPAVAGAEAGYGKVMHGGQMSLEYSEVIADESCERQAESRCEKFAEEPALYSLPSNELRPGGERGLR